MLVIYAKFYSYFNYESTMRKLDFIQWRLKKHTLIYYESNI